MEFHEPSWCWRGAQPIHTLYDQQIPMLNSGDTTMKFKADEALSIVALQVIFDRVAGGRTQLKCVKAIPIGATFGLQ